MHSPWELILGLPVLFTVLSFRNHFTLNFVLWHLYIMLSWIVILYLVSALCLFQASYPSYYSSSTDLGPLFFLFEIYMSPFKIRTPWNKSAGPWKLQVIPNLGAVTTWVLSELLYSFLCCFLVPLSGQTIHIILLVFLIVIIILFIFKVEKTQAAWPKKVPWHHILTDGIMRIQTMVILTKALPLDCSLLWKCVEYLDPRTHIPMWEADSVEGN